MKGKKTEKKLFMKIENRHFYRKHWSLCIVLIKLTSLINPSKRSKSASTDISFGCGETCHSKFWFNPRAGRFIKRQTIRVMSNSTLVGGWPPPGYRWSYCVCVIFLSSRRRLTFVFSVARKTFNGLLRSLWWNMFHRMSAPPSIIKVWSRKRNSRSLCVRYVVHVAMFSNVRSLSRYLYTCGNRKKIL